MMRIIPVMMLVGLLSTGCGCGCGKKDSAVSGNVKLQGSGASFPALIYNQWFQDFQKTNDKITIDYQATGSGAGIKAMIDGQGDFGASDAAMTKEEMSKVARGVVLLPMTAGKVVLAFNLEGIKELKLSREAYVNIFLGKITKWNDPALLKDNPGLPDKPINVITRQDSSGTSFVFTQHLAAISPEFAKSPGVNKAPNWPVGVKGKGNDGVTALIKQTPGSIGYIEYGYAKTTGLPIASLQNKDGNYIVPSTAAGQAALASVAMPDDLIAWIPDPSGKDSYPIVTYTWLICYKKYPDQAKVDALKAVVNYGLDKGQEAAEPLGYIPLPKSVTDQVKAALSQITVSQ